MFGGINIIEFTNRFSSEDTSYQYLSGLKREVDINAKNAITTIYSKEKQTYSRQCTRYKNAESVISGTLFGKLKFPL
jgi:hypothetical protein